MRIDREQANIMRRSGSTYSEIVARLGVPRSTLSDWFHRQEWSNNIAIENVKRSKNSAGIRLAVLNTVRGTRLRQVYQSARQDAVVDFDELKYHPLFMAGVMLYMAHGDKKSANRVTVSSGDPKVVKMALLFLQKVCGCKNVRVQLVLPEESAQNGGEEQVKAYWIEKTGLNIAQFMKTSVIKTNKPKNRPYNGICNLIVNSAYLKSKILKWVELMSAEICEEKYEQIDKNAGIV